MTHLCSPFCTDNCYAPPKLDPSLVHGCETCNSGIILKGEGSCVINCPNLTEIPNTENDACVACPNCCGGSSECSYDFSQKDPPLECHGTIDLQYSWNNGKCTDVPSNPINENTEAT